MVSLYNLIQAQLALQTEQRETAKIGLAITPDWRAEAGGYTRDVQEPLLGAPNLSLRESSGQGAFKYTGRPVSLPASALAIFTAPTMVSMTPTV